MELDELAIFVAVARRKSYSEAAREKYISHSTVSRTVSSLERELGVQLIVRRNRVEELTEAGKVLLADAEVLLAAAEEAAEHVRTAAKAAEAKEEVDRESAYSHRMRAASPIYSSATPTRTPRT